MGWRGSGLAHFGNLEQPLEVVSAGARLRDLFKQGSTRQDFHQICSLLPKGRAPPATFDKKADIWRVDCSRYIEEVAGSGFYVDTFSAQDVDSGLDEKLADDAEFGDEEEDEEEGEVVLNEGEKVEGKPKKESGEKNSSTVSEESTEAESDQEPLKQAKAGA